MSYMDEKHWLVAVWPLDEEGELHHERPWRTAVVHGDTEEDVMRMILTYLIPGSKRFRLWIMELKDEDGRDGTFELGVNWDADSN